MGNYRIAVIPGDGIGPEVTDAAIEIMDAVGAKFGHTFEYTKLLAGGAAIDAYGIPLPEETLVAAKESDAVLLGAVGGDKWDELPGALRPEKALLGLRKGLNLYANLRPAVLFPELASASPLRSELVKNGLNIMIVRELTGGIYFGKRGRNESEERLEDGTPKGQIAYDIEEYSEAEIERILRVGFDLANQRKKHAFIVDKANILESSRLWREVTKRVASDYPNVTYEFLYVDNASMQLVKRPAEMDVIITSNMFGDILSDEAGMITGSIGMLPSASLGVKGAPGMYEPVHGSAPDIAGKKMANPLATILSAAMLMDLSLGLKKESDAIHQAVGMALATGKRTRDIASSDQETILSTGEMTALVLEKLSTIE